MSLSKTPLTVNQKVLIMKSFVSLQAVNSVYGSGKTCTTVGKEDQVFKIWDNLLHQLEKKKGMFEDMIEIQENEFPVTIMRHRSKLVPIITGHGVWELGMKARRELTDALQPAKYGKTLKFTTMQPLTNGDVTPKGFEFDISLEVDSGKTEQDELDRLLLKVIKFLD